MRGCQKKVIYIKNTGSHIFKEAYFILDKGWDACEIKEEKMVVEASRIIEENERGKYKKSENKPLSGLCFFLTGALFGIIAVFLIFAGI